jgi:hypothetical protein
MRLILALLLTFMAASVQAQDFFEAAKGQYGSATDPANSCASNPHEMSFMSNPPHMMLTWEKPKDDGVGQPRVFERYDLEAYDGTTMTLREEGDFRPDREAGPFWVLQMTTAPLGYCWRRSDWPSVRCEDQQLRCEASVS